MRTLFDNELETVGNSIDTNGNGTKKVFANEEQQIEKEKKRKRTSQINDLDLDGWKQLSDIQTDSLWLIPSRDKSGAHSNEYHGNFVPQIPRQLIQRYTKQGEVVLDGFLGSGTSAIEASRLDREFIGIELQPKIIELAKRIIAAEQNVSAPETKIIEGDSSNEAIKENINQTLEELHKKYVSLVILHPPYHDIIKFSDNPSDLSNKESVEDFCESFGKVIENTTEHLTRGRYLAIIMGDKYTNSEWVPLGFYAMQEAMKRGFSLKSIVVKDMQNNRAKQNQQQLWRYRALVGGFYIFKHEYIFILRKK